MTLDGFIQQKTREYLMELLAHTGGNVASAAVIAGRQRTQFYVLLRKHRLGAPSGRHNYRTYKPCSAWPFPPPSTGAL